jgi:hypothetical protein
VPDYVRAGRSWTQWAAIALALAAAAAAAASVVTGWTYGPLVPWVLALAALPLGIVGFITGARSGYFVWLPTAALIAGIVAIGAGVLATANSYAVADCATADAEMFIVLDRAGAESQARFDALPTPDERATMGVAAIVDAQRPFWSALESEGAVAESQSPCSAEAMRVRDLTIARGELAQTVAAESTRALKDSPDEATLRQSLSEAFAAFSQGLADNAQATKAAIDAIPE